MRGFIHAFQGKPWNEECLSAYNGLTKLGVDCTLFSTNEELDQRKPEDIVVGGLLMISHVLNQMNIFQKTIIIPKYYSPIVEEKYGKQS